MSHTDTLEPLDLLAEFAPVPTGAWEAAIAHDLKGAAYEKKLIWRTDEGLAVRPYYRAEHAVARQPLLRPRRSWTMIAADESPALDASAIEWHDAGATAVQEIAFVLAQAADALAADGPVRTVGFAVGGNHFMEIAKLRAARLLLARVIAAFTDAAAAGPGDNGFAGTTSGGTPSAADMHLHVRTASANKTLYDPYVNLLRVTTEAMSAVIGGCDSLAISRYRFDPHLAENVHHVLREESHLDAVMDPGAGSYYIEALTDAVAQAAWGLFQHIEAAGGFEVYRERGALDAAIAASREAKSKAIASRRRVLVGTNNYPDARERALDAAREIPPGWRLASAVEAIRLRTERHAKATGRLPRVLLLEHGDLKMRKARSAFCLNFFGCAGFDLVTSGTLQPADLVILCSSDSEYLPLAREICARVPAPVIVAGNPKDRAEELRGAGVEDFVHVLSNAAEVLTRWQDRLGVKE